MKRFLSILGILLGICILTTSAFFAMQIFSGRSSQEIIGGVIYAQNLAAAKTEYDTLLIGDSVCRQIFPPEKQNESTSVCYLGTNAAVTAIGNYILMRQYLQNNPQTKKVVSLIRPQTLANDLWHNYTFQYFIVPFYTKENMQYIDEDIIERLRNEFGELFIENDMYKQLIIQNSYLLKIYLNRISNPGLITNRISEISARYLKKSWEYCKENGIEFVVFPLPLSDFEKERNWKEYQNDIIDFELQNLLKDYFNGINWYPENCFSDGVHFEREYFEKNRINIIEQIGLDFIFDSN
jgi:hypothetical protein